MNSTNNEIVKKILIVDDEIDILETLEELLDMFYPWTRLILIF